MFLKILLLLFTLKFTSLIKAEKTCGTPVKSAHIGNGTVSHQGEWPWIASIHDIKTDAFICGGTLIGSNVILTAAHCIQEKGSSLIRQPTEFIVKLGKHDLTQRYERGSEVRYPHDVIIHPDWKYFDPRFDADIAIITLDSKVQFTDFVSPICLWNKNSERKRKRGVVVGWGKSGNGNLQTKPRQLDVFLRSDSECLLKNPRFSAIVSENTFCAGKYSESGPCNGDSGSGLFVRSDSKQWYLRGIVSSGFIENGTCGISADAVFTDVLKYNDWITEIASNYNIEVQSLTTDASIITKQKKFNKEIFCFFESWAVGRNGDGAFSFDHLKPELCTTLVFLHAVLEDESLKSINPWQQTASNGEQLYKKFTDLKRSHRGLRTLLSVGSWNEGSVKYSQLAANSERRKRFAKNSAEFLQKYRFDGLHFHWEYPAHRGGDSADKENFVLLLKEIHEVFKSQNLYLSVFVRVEKDVVEKAYDLENIAKYVDAILMMTFDLAGPWESRVGFHAPLRGFGENNIESRVNYFKEFVPADKIILGIPFYGRTFVTDNGGNIGESTVDNYGFPGPFYRENGFLGYNEICYMRRDNKWDVRFDLESSQAIGKFKSKGLTNVVTFDSPRSVANKVKFLIENNLAGAWTWFVDSDDFRSHCEMDPTTTTFADFKNVTLPTRNERDFPLLRTLNEAIELLTPQKPADDDESTSDWLFSDNKE